MDDSGSVADVVGGGPAEKSGGPGASRRSSGQGSRGRGTTPSRRDGKASGREHGAAGRRVRRQVLFDAETAVRFDVHCRGEFPQLDPVKELNRILLGYLRRSGRKRRALDADFPRQEIDDDSDMDQDRQSERTT